jgi:hypothetical protein
MPVIPVVCIVDLPYDVPRLGLDDAAGLADLIEGMV